jgi:HEAT repeat protein
MGGEAAAQALVAHLADPEPHARAAVTTALGRVGDPTKTSALLPLLTDNDPVVVRAAAHALGRIGDSVAAAPLAQALSRPDQPLLVRRALAAAIAQAPHPDAQPALLQTLSDPDPQVRGYAAEALGHVGSEAAHDALAALRSDRARLLKGTVGDVAARALTMLERRGRRTSPVPQTPAVPAARAEE